MFMKTVPLKCLFLTFSFVFSSLFFPFIAISQVDFQWAIATTGYGSGYITATGLIQDNEQNLCVFGNFQGIVDFDPGEGEVILSSNLGSNQYISKYDTIGNLLWVLSFGADNTTQSNSFSIDPQGNLYLSGYFNGNMDADPGPGVYMLTSQGLSDIYLIKLDKDGNFIMAVSIGGSTLEYESCIYATDSGEVFIAGTFHGTVDFDPGPGNDIHTAQDSDGFICKYDSAGNYCWVKCIEGPGEVVFSCITSDLSGNLHIGGWFEGTSDFDAGESVYNMTDEGYGDNFILNITPDGSFIKAACYGGVADNHLIDIKTDNSGAVYLVGNFNYQTDFCPGPEVFMVQTVGFVDAYMLKLNNEYQFEWVYPFGGEDLDDCASVWLDENNDIYLTGVFYYSVDFDAGPGEFIVESWGDGDNYLLKINSAGEFEWVVTGGNADGDYGISLIQDDSGNIFQLGIFSGSMDFDPGEGEYILECTSQNDIFIRKFSQSVTTKINHPTPANPVNCYPNPASEFIFIYTDKPSDVGIYNSTGALVLQTKTVVGINQISVSELAAGNYYISTRETNQMSASKLIIQR